jgi:Tol biopolymer transport system component
VERVSGEEAACCPELSPDGEYLYFIRDLPGRSIGTAMPRLHRVPLAGGEEKQVFSDVLAYVGFVVVPEGIYYAAESDSAPAVLRFFSLQTRERRDLMRWEQVLWGFSLSPDGRRLLFAKKDLMSEDLMLVEGFR